MKMSELSQASGVPVATIKFYLREQLLPEGVRTSATQAQYDESHLSRLRLVRALLGTGGLSVAEARRVLDQVDGPPLPPAMLLGAAHDIVIPTSTRTAHPRADAAMERWGWKQECGPSVLAALEEALAAVDAAGLELTDEQLDVYAQAMLDVARSEIAAAPEAPDEAVRYVVLGTVLVEPLLLALRRIAQQHATVERYG